MTTEISTVNFSLKKPVVSSTENDAIVVSHRLRRTSHLNTTFTAFCFSGSFTGFAGIESESFFFKISMLLVSFTLAFIVLSYVASYMTTRRFMRRAMKMNPESLKGFQNARSVFGLPFAEQKFEISSFDTYLSPKEVEKVKEGLIISHSSVKEVANYTVHTFVENTSKGVFMKQVFEPTMINLWDESAKAIMEIHDFGNYSLEQLKHEYIPEALARKEEREKSRIERKMFGLY